MWRRFGFCAVAFSFLAALFFAPAAQAQVGAIALTNGDFELPGPAGTKVIAFNNDGTPNVGIIPGWTFSGPGVETFGHDGTGTPPSTLIMGDSGTEGNGGTIAGNELLLSTFDGKVSQTSAVNVASIPTSQQYRLSFDAHNIFTTYGAAGSNTDTTQYSGTQTLPTQLTVRLYYGAAKTTLASQVYAMTGTRVNDTLTVNGGAAAIAAAVGQPIGVEFDTTTFENSQAINATTPANPVANHSWVGVDNVLLQVSGILPGDLNGDGVLSIADYRVIRDHLQTSSFYLANGELTGDGVVDLNDFRAWTKIAGPLPGAGAGAAGGGAVPEPSTIVMTIILAGMTFAGSVLRKGLGNLHRPRLLLLATIAAAVGLAAASRCGAVQLAYEPFNYAAGVLTGQSPSGSFFTGGWTTGAMGFGSVQNVQAASLNYLGSPSTGGSVNNGGGAPGGREGIRLANDWTATTDSTFMLNPNGSQSATPNPSGAYYIGWEQSYGTTAGGDGSMGFRAEEFWPVGDDIAADGGRSSVDYNTFGGDGMTNPATARLQLKVSGFANQIVSNAPASYNADNNTTHLLILKFQLSPTGNDTVSLFFDPTSASEPAIPSATATVSSFTLHALGSGANLGGGGVTLPGIFDELRVGTTYADVIPTLPFPGDTDGDGDVDLVDYQHIVDNFNKSGQDTLHGDVALSNGQQGADGNVDLGDFHLWKTDFPHPGSGSGALGGGSVPEPSTLALASLAVLISTFVLRCK